MLTNKGARDFALTPGDMAAVDAISGNGAANTHFCWDPSSVP